MKPKYVVLNSNLTKPGFPHNIEIRFAPSKKIFVAACQDATKYFFNWSNLIFVHYEESLLSSNLNSKLFRFHIAHPNLHTAHLLRS